MIVIKCNFNEFKQIICLTFPHSKQRILENNGDPQMRKYYNSKIKLYTIETPSVEV